MADQADLPSCKIDSLYWAHNRMKAGTVISLHISDPQLTLIAAESQWTLPVQMELLQRRVLRNLNGKSEEKKKFDTAWGLLNNPRRSLRDCSFVDKCPVWLAPWWDFKLPSPGGSSSNKCNSVSRAPCDSPRLRRQLVRRWRIVTAPARCI